ncbi:MAG: 4Fe-4S binding protein [Gammaproteobacteria bacterium]|nr:4Fe-4S binding protein [Gammaproteobacteria bacterium]
MTAVTESRQTTGSGAGWPATTPDGVARAAALELLNARARTPASVVTYQAGNSLLVVVEDRSGAEAVLAELPSGLLQITVLVADPDKRRIELSELGGFELVHARVAHFDGHLGRFVVRIAEDGEARNLAKAAGQQREDFDLVLDLCGQPHIRAPVPPPGYYAPRSEQALHETLEALPEMVGEFDKPKYFQYDADICAHGSSGIPGCTRCLDACPTLAIQSLGERIEVDPFLCQGGGVCATACPTGAITYQYPRVSDLLENLRRALRRYHDESGRGPWLLIVDDADGRETVTSAADNLPENILPLFVEEVGSVGMDAWLAALCYGAHGVSIACTSAPMTEQLRHELAHQVRIANTLLAGLDLPADRIRLLDLGADGNWVSELPGAPVEPVVAPTGFAAVEEKRTNLRLALDHLYENAPGSPQRVELPPGSPFGEIRVDRDKCTLCMACVSVCPASALHDGEDLPMLRFIENNCVQCGICETACPEDAIDLRPLYTYDSEQRARMRTLNEEKPFPCIRCGKPFTTEKMMQTIRGKLAGHWMFQDQEQRRRLEMCEDCRVQDMFTGNGGLDPYDKSAGPGH